MRRLLGFVVLSTVVTTVLPSLATTGPARAAAAPAAAPAAEPGAERPPWRWVGVSVDTDQQLRGLDAVDARTAWVGGSEGGVWRTTDGGRTWRDVSPPDAGGLLIRDVEAADARTALAMTIGEGRDSRIYRTTNGGRTWKRTFLNRDPAAFYDCLAMWPGDRRGLAMSDPVGGRFRILSTRDGGATWRQLPRRGMPDATGEFGFAASGTCLVTAGVTQAYLASGGSAARVFHSRNRGRDWKAVDSTLPASEAGGVFSLAFRNPRTGIAVGGDFEVEGDGVDRAATTRDAGRRWRNADDLGGYRSGVDFWRADRAVAVGPNGTDLSRDAGRTWTTFSRLGFDAVQCVTDRAIRADTCWASGEEGRVARLVRRR